MNSLKIKSSLHKNYVERDEIWERVARELYIVKQKVKEFKKEEDALLESLKQLSYGINSKGEQFIFTKINNKGRIDYKLMSEVENIDCEPYRKESTESWKLEPVLTFNTKETL